MSDDLHSNSSENNVNENQAGGLEDAVAADVLHELEDGQRVRVTSPSYEVEGTVYGDTRRDHVITSLSGWEPGPVMLAWHDHLERVERLEVL